MNDFLVKVKSLLNNFINFFKINPHKHWAFLLGIFFTLSSILILFSLYLLYQIKNDQIFQVKVVSEEKKSLLDESLLKKNTDINKLKEDKILELNNNPFPYKDPSF